MLASEGPLEDICHPLPIPLHRLSLHHGISGCWQPLTHISQQKEPPPPHHFEMGPLFIDQAGLKFLASSDPPILASQNAKITGMSHHSSQVPCDLPNSLPSTSLSSLRNSPHPYPTREVKENFTFREVIYLVSSYNH
ncbi:hypothetical protein AAY473_028190 [Plecturocebus cupreus]